MASFLILGCGYTGSRVAAELRALGHSVLCTQRHATDDRDNDPFRAICDISDDRNIADLSSRLHADMSVLYSIPTIGQVPVRLFSMLREFGPSRFIYLSTTGVYGSAPVVNSDTIACPQSERDEERLNTEQLVSEHFSQALILRPAAIYGPHRGIHVAARNGVFRPPPGGNRMISRIHVDDLANHVLAGFQSDVGGAFPVADEEPCPSLELAEWTCRYLNLPQPVVQGSNEDDNRAHKGGRRVDGSRIRELLQLRLLYPTFREGVPNCLRVEEV